MSNQMFRNGLKVVSPTNPTHIEQWPDKQGVGAAVNARLQGLPEAAAKKLMETVGSVSSAESQQGGDLLRGLATGGDPDTLLPRISHHVNASEFNRLDMQKTLRDLFKDSKDKKSAA